MLASHGTSFVYICSELCFLTQAYQYQISDFKDLLLFTIYNQELKKIREESDLPRCKSQWCHYPRPRVFSQRPCFRAYPYFRIFLIPSPSNGPHWVFSMERQNYMGTMSHFLNIRREEHGFRIRTTNSYTLK